MRSPEQSLLCAAYTFNKAREQEKLERGRAELMEHSHQLQEYCRGHNVRATPLRPYKYWFRQITSIFKGKFKILSIDYVDANGSRRTGFFFTFDQNSWFFFPRIIIPNYSWMRS